MRYISIKELNIYDSFDSFQNMLIVVENKELLYSLLLDMNSDGVYKNYFSILDEQDKEINLKDEIQYIPSLINMSINNKKNNNSLLRLIKKTNGDLLNLCSQNVSKILEEIFKKIRLELNLNIISNIEISNDDILKFMDILIKDDSDNPLDRINLYIKTSFELFGIRIFVFYNLFSILRKDQFDILMTDCIYNDIKIIDIENYDDFAYKFDKKYIIDDDICLIKND